MNVSNTVAGLSTDCQKLVFLYFAEHSPYKMFGISVLYRNKMLCCVHIFLYDEPFLKKNS